MVAGSLTQNMRHHYLDLEFNETETLFIIEFAVSENAYTKRDVVLYYQLNDEHRYYLTRHSYIRGFIKPELSKKEIEYLLLSNDINVIIHNPIKIPIDVIYECWYEEEVYGKIRSNQ